MAAKIRFCCEVLHVFFLSRKVRITEGLRNCWHFWVPLQTDLSWPTPGHNHELIGEKLKMCTTRSSAYLETEWNTMNVKVHRRSYVRQVNRKFRGPSFTKSVALVCWNRNCLPDRTRSRIGLKLKRWCSGDWLLRCQDYRWLWLLSSKLWWPFPPSVAEQLESANQGTFLSLNCFPQSYSSSFQVRFNKISESIHTWMEKLLGQMLYEFQPI